ncbi:MAG: hypothetical protein E8A46_17630 [Bradyrhizobium sp.]|jgi:hypothetical protein|uniref:hypothetical protein n=1 Tax=Bradyrhizobium sp. TaxID=376 RepID=UPI00120528FA|nr:hypothetical protein [Bradyrhizobium sp.]THD50640.1 MAG: hypothetical protein E8A46_17630 [Bradyrhizobium sp.]
MHSGRPSSAGLPRIGIFVSARWENVGIAAAAMLAIGIPFVAFANLVLFHFYARGSFVLDTGLLASLMWHSDAALTQPASLGGSSYFGTHVSLLFLPASALSRCLPLSMPQFFAGIVGFSHALLALAVFWLLVEGFGLRRGVGPWIAALAALGFAFSGLAIAIARYPHFETLIAAFFLLFAVAQVLGHPRLAVVFFVLGLATREDAGFHYVAILGLLVMLNAACGVPLRQQRTECTFALAALFYAIAAMAVQRLIFPETSAFARVYVGDPPLAHLGAGLIAHRIGFFLVGRPYILYPALGACIWALRARNPCVVLGFVAGIPWALLHLLAKSPLAGALVSYYAFPFLIALAWPLIGVMRQQQRTGNAGDPTSVLAGFATLLALSFFPGVGIHDPGQLPLPQAFWDPPSRAQQAATDRAAAALSAARPMLGRLLVDNSIAALAPNGFAQKEVPFLQGNGSTPSETTTSPDTVAFFAEGYDAQRLRAIADAAGLARRYAMPGTQIHLAARQRLEDVPLLAGLMAAEQGDAQK